MSLKITPFFFRSHISSSNSTFQWCVSPLLCAITTFFSSQSPKHPYQRNLPIRLILYLSAIFLLDNNWCKRSFQHKNYSPFFYFSTSSRIILFWYLWRKFSSKYGKLFSIWWERSPKTCHKIYSLIMIDSRKFLNRWIVSLLLVFRSFKNHHISIFVVKVKPKIPKSI